MYLVALVVLCYIQQVVTGYDCYDQKCEGIGEFYSTYINCDQYTYKCSVDKSGYPECKYNGIGGGKLILWGKQSMPKPVFQALPFSPKYAES